MDSLTGENADCSVNSGYRGENQAEASGKADPGAACAPPDKPVALRVDHDRHMNN